MWWFTASTSGATSYGTPLASSGCRSCAGRSRNDARSRLSGCNAHEMPNQTSSAVTASIGTSCRSSRRSEFWRASMRRSVLSAASTRSR